MEQPKQQKTGKPKLQTPTLQRLIMKTLKSYYKNKYDFEIVYREGDTAIAKGKSRLGGDHINWEVIKISSHNGLTMPNGVFVPPAEFPPSDNQWGVKGWTAHNETHAYELFNSKKNEN